MPSAVSILAAVAAVAVALVVGDTPAIDVMLAPPVNASEAVDRRGPAMALSVEMFRRTGMIGTAATNTSTTITVESTSEQTAVADALSSVGNTPAEIAATLAAAALALAAAVVGAAVSAAQVVAVSAATLLAVGVASYLVLLGEKAKRAVEHAAWTTAEYYRALWYFLGKDGSFETCPHFAASLQARCHVYSLAQVFFIWDRPHYRNGTFQDDMIKNLRDVAIPGTGVPLDLVAYTKLGSYLMILVGNPAVAAVAAINAGRTDAAAVAAAYAQQLVEPQDWFSFWRLNCRLATLHAGLTGETDYELEDKWKFLTVAEERNVAVTPYMKVAGIVCKHRNEEGGLGFESFDNASEGGDWIIQRKLDNGPFLNSMLPPNAPLSTFRIISASRGGLKSNTAEAGNVTMDDVQALSCVWRAGRAKAKTDHSAILFNVDPDTGVIKRGTTNVHWYQRGPGKVLTTPWTSEHSHTHHPDSGQQITGVQVPNMKEMMDFVRDAHLRLIPHVPLCGWDVALTANDGMLLLEGNFSCNFFRGDFDQKAYFEFVSDYFVDLERRRADGTAL